MIRTTIKKILKEEFSLDEKFRFFRRNIVELENHLADIVMEGFEYVNPCDYESKDKYIKDIVISNAITLINSYNELQKGGTDDIEEYIKKFVYDKYKFNFNHEWEQRYCDDEGDDEYDDFINMIQNTK
jgi:hypothetical protein